MVRLGEHDFAKTTDGEHEDLLVTRSLVHEHYDKSLMINDIALLGTKFHFIDFLTKLKITLVYTHI